MEYIKIPANALDQIENKAELVLFGLYYSQISRGQMENYFTQEYVYNILKMNSRTFTAGIKSLYDKELLRWGWGRRDGAEYWARKVMPNDADLRPAARIDGASPCRGHDTLRDRKSVV